MTKNYYEAHLVLDTKQVQGYLIHNGVTTTFLPGDDIPVSIPRTNEDPKGLRISFVTRDPAPGEDYIDANVLRRELEKEEPFAVQLLKREIVRLQTKHIRLKGENLHYEQQRNTAQLEVARLRRIHKKRGISDEE